MSLVDLQAFYDALPTKPVSRQRTLRSVKSLLAFGQRIGYLRYDLGAAFTMRRPSRNLAQRILDRDSVLRMIELEGNARNKALLMTSL